MTRANLTTFSSSHFEIYSFKRRDFLPLEDNWLWQIEAGVVRTTTLTEDGTLISLGFWGGGEIVGQPLSRIRPYQIECLTEVKASRLGLERFWAMEPHQSWQTHQVMLAHIHQTQELLRINNGPVTQRLQQLLEWLAYKFGCPTEYGQLIELWLTHQDIADAIGSSRVTITRLLHQFKQKGWISFSRQQGILLHGYQ
jgi:CRP-like cAMP-binding protein